MKNVSPVIGYNISNRIGTERIAILFAIAASLLFELGMAERKYGLFGGGFGQSHALAGGSEIALFLLTVLTAQTLIVGLAYRLIGGLMKNRVRRLVRLFAFLFLTIGLLCGVVIGKFQLLSYFSDTVSFGLLRNLGGGSLLDAALFGLSESALIVQILGGIVLLWLICLFLIRRVSNPHDKSWPCAVSGRAILSLCIAMPILLLWCNAYANVRYAVVRMTTPALITDALNLLTDFDRDGYSWFSPLRDNAPFDASRHPMALDIPNNGIDEDGLAGDLKLPPQQPEPPLPTLPAHPKHLVLIVLESTRGDVMGKRVNGQVVAPNMEALARSGSSAAEAYSHVGFTTASLKSLFTGQLEPKVGAPSLFRDLRHAGYRIAVFSGQPEDFGDISAVTGMRENADIFSDAEAMKADRAFGFAAQGSLLVDESKLLGEFDRRLGKAADWQKPTFVYFNFQSPHFPYHHDGMVDRIEKNPIPRGNIDAANRDHVQRTYWNAVSYSDRMIGEVIAKLKALGIWQDTLLVVTADHGESLFEDGFLGHGHRINRIQTHVPLILSEPGVDLSGPIGLRDYRRIILSTLAGRTAATPRKQVLRYIGSLDEPVAIGLVNGSGTGWAFDTSAQESWFENRNLYRRYADMAPGSAERRDTEQLIHVWGAERWATHVPVGR
ncbi:MAG TPA: sulfatase-like hydrolase/transferase [Sphingobium sp.]|uniref:LTA synthase family protein n=1 Tax=Sphingobium sp. TaxID=1912891 RepID=UPI002ED3F709